MLEINLLPRELRAQIRARVFALSRKFLILIIILQAVIVAAIFVNLEMKIRGKQIELNQINADVEALKAQVRDVGRLQENARLLEQKVKIIQDLLSARTSWARKLTSLNNLIPENIWFISLSLGSEAYTSVTVEAGKRITQTQTRKILNLQGKVIALPEEKAINLIGLLMKKMKDDPLFFSDFSSVELVGINREGSPPDELMNFQLRCPFK